MYMQIPNQQLCMYILWLSKQDLDNVSWKEIQLNAPLAALLAWLVRARNFILIVNKTRLNA